MRSSSGILRILLFPILIGVIAFTSGCSSFFGAPRQIQHSSSVVNYLYPKDRQTVIPQSIPVLNLPLKVGIAFVPPTNRSSADGVSEAQKQALLQKVADAFKEYPFVQAIEIIPSIYLRAGGGFDNLDQIKNLLGVEVVALVSYDQVQFTSDNVFSLAYWTIVGAYVFAGNKNDTHTLLEAAVYDISSQKLLFRAPGASQVKGTSTALKSHEALRLDSGKGFGTATDDLIVQLKAQLEQFRERIKQAPDQVQIVHRPGYTGAGALDGGLAFLLALWGGLYVWSRRNGGA